MLSEFETYGATLYHRESETLLIADMHLGRAGEGLFEFSEDAFYEMKTSLKKAFEKFNPAYLCIVGDTFQSRMADQKKVRDMYTEICELCSSYNCQLKPLYGNHDPFDFPNGASVDPERTTNIDGWQVFHGHDVIPVQSTKYIFAHFHPQDSNGNRCFIHGKDDGFEFIVLPAFNPILQGLPITKVNWERVPLDISDPEINTYSVKE